MSNKTEKLLALSSGFEKKAIEALISEAKKKDSKKLDPKAKVRNRGTVCVPAEQAKDNKDHFPINDEGQARNALARVQQLSSAPWYKGSLEGLKALVARKVKAKYPKIDVGGKKKEKKSALESALYSFGEEVAAKYGQSQTPKQYWVNGRWTNEAPATVPTGAKMRSFEDGAWFTYTMDEDGTWSSAGPEAQPDTSGKGSPNTITIPTTTISGPRGGGSAGGNSSQWGLPQEQAMVSKIQAYLMSQKINVPGGADGKLGPMTKAALGVWQKQAGLPVTKELDTATWNKLSEVIPELKAFTQAATTVQAPIDLGAARARIEAARGQASYLLKAYQGGQLRDPRGAQNALEQLQPFLDDERAGITAIVKQLNALAQSPQLEATQKEQIQGMLFNANDTLTALMQWRDLLSGQFAQTGQISGVNKPVI